MDYIFDPYDRQISQTYELGGELVKRNYLIDSKRPCYFNIIDIEQIKDDFIDREEGGEFPENSNYGFNKEVFEFFVKRKMFDENKISEE